MAEKFEISRVFTAPRQRVWEAWTKPEQFMCWYAPKGIKHEVKHFDLRPGGHLHSRLEAPDGAVSWGMNTYRTIDPPRLIVWEQGFSNEAGEIVPSPFPMPWPLRLLTTVRFENEGENTRITLCWEPLDANDGRISV